MSICVSGRPDSDLISAVVSPTLRELVDVMDENVTLIIPTSAQAAYIRKLWAEYRPGIYLPNIQTMAAFIRSLHAELQVHIESSGGDGSSGKPSQLMDDAEAALLLDLARADCNEAFLPPGLSVDAIVRWKQELLTAQNVGHMYLEEDMPRRLEELNRIIPIWNAYETRKADRFLDKGDITLQVVDGVARYGSQLHPRRVLVYLTHGLTVADRTLLHLLISHEWDVAIRFASLADVDVKAEQRSLNAAMWLIAHGWSQEENGELENSRNRNEDSNSENSRTRKHNARIWDTQREEMRRALGAVKLWSAEGIALDDMCIIVPSSGSYDDALRDMARRAGVPLAMSDRLLLRHNGYATAVLAACNVVARGWERSDVDRLINSGYVSYGTLPVEGLSQAASRARVVGGKGWREWVELLHDEGKAIISWLAEILDVGSDVVTAARFGQWLNDRVLHGLGLDAPKELVDSITAYIMIADRHIARPLPISEHVRRWWSVVSSMDTVAKGTRLQGIAVCKPHEARGREFARVIAVGFVDGELPARKKDVVHEELLAGLREAMDVEAYSDIVNACAPDGKLICMAPKLTDGIENVLSVFLNSNTDACGVQVLDDKEHGILLDMNDARAYRDGIQLDVSERQLGLKAEQLPEAARNKVFELVGRPLSPSSIDKAAQCPYQYYAFKILGIREETVDDIALTPQEKGSLLHATVKEFYDRIRGRTVEDITSINDVRNAFIDITTRPFDEMLDVLFDVYEKQRLVHPVGHLYDPVERRIFEGHEDRRGLLHQWLQSEVDLQKKTEFRPFLFEVAINDAIDIGERHNEMLDLRIDRVDGAIEGDVLHCVVIDYKSTTNGIPSANQMQNGLSTQLPLYARAIERYFEKRDIHAQTVGGAYRVFGSAIKEKSGPTEKSKLPTTQKLDIHEEVDAILTLTASNVDVIRSGHYPLAPTAKACERCTAKEICRIDHWGQAL